MANEVTVNVTQFNADLQKFAEQINADIVTITKNVALTVYERVVGRTPWDTGRARAGWNISRGDADLSFPPVGIYPEFQGDAEFTAASVGITKETFLAGMQTPEVVWVANAVPYIQPLEDGNSQQAPNGMAAITVAEVEAEIDFFLS